MRISRINIVLGVLLVVIAITLVAAAGGDRSVPNVEFLPDMKRSPAYSAYAPNPHLPKKRTLQPPVPGTIARGETPLHFTPTPEDAVRAGEAIVNPFSTRTTSNPAASSNQGAEDAHSLPASVRRGGNVFRVSCTPCHGGGGQGDGLVVRKGYPAPTESLVTGTSTKMKDGQLFHIITYGKYPAAATEPPRFPRMPSFAPQLSPTQRWDVINFIRSLQEAKAAEPPAPVNTGEEAEEADGDVETEADADADADAQPLGSDEEETAEEANEPVETDEPPDDADSPNGERAA